MVRQENSTNFTIAIPKMRHTAAIIAQNVAADDNHGDRAPASLGIHTETAFLSGCVRLDNVG